MSLMLRVQTVDGRDVLLSPARDIINFYPTVVGRLFAVLEKKNWVPEDRAFFEQHGLTEKALLAAAADLGKFCEEAAKPSNETVQISIEASGFLTHPEMVQRVVLGKLGQICAGAFWLGLRSTTPNWSGELDVKAVADAGRQLAQYAKELPDDA